MMMVMMMVMMVMMVVMMMMKGEEQYDNDDVDDDDDVLFVVFNSATHDAMVVVSDANTCPGLARRKAQPSRPRKMQLAHLWPLASQTDPPPNSSPTQRVHLLLLGGVRSSAHELWARHCRGPGALKNDWRSSILPGLAAR